MSRSPKRWHGLTILLVAAILFLGLRTLPGMIGNDTALDFTPDPNIPGLRRLTAGQTSQSVRDPFLGVDMPGTDRGPATPPAPTGPALCDALFFEGTGDGGAVPVAYFVDYACPFCRVFSDRIAARERQGDIVVSWHDLPLLGPGSQVAARAAAAARLQDGYDAMHALLMSNRFVPTPELMEFVAQDAGLSGSALVADMSSRQVERTLTRTRSVAEAFGVYGTPTLVVGQTLVVGEIGPDRLSALIARERDESASGPCPFDPGG